MMARHFVATSSQYLQVASAVVTDAPCTLTGWVYLTDVAASYELVSLSQGAGSAYYITANTNSTPNLVGYYRNSSTAFAVDDSTLTAETWHHFACVFTSNASRIVYLDADPGTESTTSITAMANIDTTALGRRTLDTPANYLNGNLAEVAIYSAALGQTAITNLATNKHAPSIVQTGDLEAYWPLIDDDNDDSGNGYNLTANGSPTYTTHVPDMVYTSGLSIPIAMRHYLDQ